MGSIVSGILALQGLNSSGGAWRPPQWSQPAQVSITVPPQATTSVPTYDQQGNAVFQAAVNSTTTYVFDAVLELDHEQRVGKTQHPIQTGSAISSHAIIHPARLSMLVGMSDAMDSYSGAVSQVKPPFVQSWTGGATKSISAYQKMLELQAVRIPLTVKTKLRIYDNMIITAVNPREDYRTRTGLRMRLEFEQIFVASTQVVPNSARPNDTNNTGLGTVNSQVPGTALLNQFDLSRFREKLPSFPVNVPGAGSFSSVNTNSVKQLLSAP